MLIQLIIAVFVVFVAVRMAKKLKKKEITVKEFVLWLLFWILVLTATLLPKTADVIADFVGVERGSNLAVYLSIIVLFYLIFRIMVKLEEINRNITKIVRETAINQENNKGGIKK